MGGVEVDDRLGAAASSSTSWVAAARSAARWWVADTCAGRVEVDPQAARRRRRSSSSQRTSAWPPFSWGRMYGTYCSVTVERASGRRARRACGPGTSRAARCRTSRACSRPGTTSRTVPTRGRSASASGIVDGLGRRGSPPSASARTTVARARISIAGSRSSPASTIGRRPRVAVDRDEPALEPVDARVLPSAAAMPPIRSLSVGARQSESARRVREAAGGRCARRRRRCRRSSRPTATSRCAVDDAVTDRHLERADLEALPAPRRARPRSANGVVSQASPASADAVPRSPAGSTLGAARRARRPGTANAATRRRPRPRPSAPTSRAASRGRAKCCWFVIVDPAARGRVERDRAPARPAPGAPTARASGVRSGQTRPSAQKLPSLGSSPKSPP